MNSDEMRVASREQLENRMKELEKMPNVETKFPENMELQVLRQMLVPGFQPPPLRRGHGIHKAPTT
jgi:hypothetical protein